MAESEPKLTVGKTPETCTGRIAFLDLEGGSVGAGS